MCCFTGVIESVSKTNIFARSAERGRQHLVYSMDLNTKSEVAMVLPLPVPAKSGEKALIFVNLEKYPKLFNELAAGFVVPGRSPGQLWLGRPRESLEVVSVGSFEASFVPSVADFDRLDARFRLGKETWGKLPGYRDWGFAVFKLKKGNRRIHPMAFSFPRRDPSKLFFPTVHIHDGTVKAKASFDHSLYCQAREGERLGLREWTESTRHAGTFTKAKLTKGIVDPDAHVYRRKMNGMLKNADVVV